jgi:two-component system OmpR family sensor kinase
LVIKLSEKESLLKAFILFFFVIEFFLSFIFYHYQHIEKRHLDDQLLLEMKNYSFSLDDDRFDIDLITSNPQQTPPLYTLLENQKEHYMIIPLSLGNEQNQTQMKIFYSNKLYQQQLHTIHHKLFQQFILLSLFSFIISILFAFYILKPIRNALLLLEMFIKDIIHDLNTPLSAILLNIKMIPNNSEEIESIAHSAKTISMLHQNLNNYLNTSTSHDEQFDLQVVLQEQIDFFQNMYDYLQWDVFLDTLYIETDKGALSRILYNLLSNACKYNTSNGNISISLQNKQLSISNDSYGIQQPKRIFERFYKESERGIGIGLHIVQKLSQTLKIPLKLHIEKKRVEFILSFDKLTIN